MQLSTDFKHLKYMKHILSRIEELCLILFENHEPIKTGVALDERYEELEKLIIQLTKKTDETSDRISAEIKAVKLFIEYQLMFQKTMELSPESDDVKRDRMENNLKQVLMLIDELKLEFKGA